MWRGHPSTFWGQTLIPLPHTTSPWFVTTKDFRVRDECWLWKLKTIRGRVEPPKGYGQEIVLQNSHFSTICCLYCTGERQYSSLRKIQSTDTHPYKWFQKVHMLEISSIWHLRAKTHLQQPQMAMPNIYATMYLVCCLCQFGPATLHKKPRSGLRTQSAELGS